MDKSFSTTEFINHVASELIQNFVAAGRATTPSLVGGARESELRRKLESLLPPSVGVGTGCVIDSYGCTSKQTDIVIYEKDICPIFAINDTPESTYFPCEGVIAVGEVKSRLDTKELCDSIAKIQSVKELKRHSKLRQDGLLGAFHAPRSYGSIIAHGTSPKDGFDQKKNENDQIFGFVFAGELGVSEKTICERAASEIDSIEAYVSPNVFCILNHGLLMYVNNDADPSGKLCLSRVNNATGIQSTGKRDENFQYLLRLLHRFIRIARTTEVSAFERYFMGDSDTALMLLGPYSQFPNGS